MDLNPGYKRSKACNGGYDAGPRSPFLTVTFISPAAKGLQGVDCWWPKAESLPRHGHGWETYLTWGYTFPRVAWTDLGVQRPSAWVIQKVPSTGHLQICYGLCCDCWVPSLPFCPVLCPCSLTGISDNTPTKVPTAILTSVSKIDTSL
jgi:hypothetical protein